MLEINPVGTQVLLKRVAVSSTRIITSSTHKDDSRYEFVVVRVGRLAQEVKPGDIVGGMVLMNVKFRGQDFWLADEKNLVSYFRENPKATKHVEGVTADGPLPA